MHLPKECVLHASYLSASATSSAGLHPLISLVLRSYREIYPNVQTKLEEAGSQKQLDRLISEKLDIAFLRAPISRDIGLKHHHILDEPMMVALPIGHPLTQKEKISSNDLSNENFVLFEKTHIANVLEIIFQLFKLI